MAPCFKRIVFLLIIFFLVSSHMAKQEVELELDLPSAGSGQRPDQDDIRRVVEVNYLGTVWCCREAVRRMSTRHGGTGGAIVNLSSGAASLGSPGAYVWYAGAKGAIGGAKTASSS